MDDGDGDARASSSSSAAKTSRVTGEEEDASSSSSSGRFSVLARRVDGADVGPVTIKASDGTVWALKQALYDAPWRLRERGVGTTEEEVAKPAGPGNLRVLANGRVAEPDSKSLRELGMAADGKTRVVHMVVSARGASRSETRALEYGWKKGDASRGRPPQCCSVM